MTTLLPDDLALVVPGAGACAAPEVARGGVRRARSATSLALALYVVLVVALVWFLWWWWWNGGTVVGRIAGRNDQGDMLFFVAPLLLAVSAALALAGPLVRSRASSETVSVPANESEHAALFDHVRRIAHAVDAPEPVRIEFAMTTSIWSGDARWLGRTGQREFVLVIGAPLVECTSVIAFTGHVAASLGAYSGLRALRASRWAAIAHAVFGEGPSVRDEDDARNDTRAALWRWADGLARLVRRGLLRLARVDVEALERTMDVHSDLCARCVVGHEVVDALFEDIQRADDARDSAHEELYTLWLMCELDPGVDLIGPIGDVARAPRTRESDPVLAAPASRIVDDWQRVCVELSEAYVEAEFGRWKPDEPRD